MDKINLNIYIKGIISKSTQNRPAFSHEALFLAGRHCYLFDHFANSMVRFTSSKNEEMDENEDSENECQR